MAALAAEIAKTDADAETASAAASSAAAASGDPHLPPWWSDVMCGGGGRRVCLWSAPMVGQSEPAFRMLVRRYGATVCTTPMIDAGGYARSAEYRREFPWFDEAGDRPLVAQLGGSHIPDLVESCRLVEPHCDAVELNVGCPQKCARRANYGAYLMSQPELLASVVRAMAAAVSVPVFVKIRVFDDVAETVALAKQIEAAGASVLTVHGRTKEAGEGRKLGVHLADWTKIKAVKEALRIPVVSNGNLVEGSDVLDALRYTGCDGVMSGMGLLSNPTLFSGLEAGLAQVESERGPRSDPVPGEGDGGSDDGDGGRGGAPGGGSTGEGSGGGVSGGGGERKRQVCRLADDPIALALEYVDLAEQYDAQHQQITKHLAAMLGNATRRDPDLRGTLLGFRAHSSEVEPLRVALGELARRTAARKAGADSEGAAHGAGGGGAGEAAEARPRGGGDTEAT